MERYQLKIVIPAFNEENSIYRVVKNIIPHGEVIVVDDGSSDKTSQKAKLAGAIVISHKTNLGYDSAINSGFREALKREAEFILTFDADGQHDENMIKFASSHLEEGYDLVLGKRKNKQRWAEIIFSLYTNYKWKIKDPLSGFKLYKANIYRSLGYFDSYKSIGTELLLYALQKKYNVKEFPMITKERKDMPRFGSNLNSNIKILRSLFIHIFSKRK